MMPKLVIAATGMWVSGAVAQVPQPPEPEVQIQPGKADKVDGKGLAAPDLAPAIRRMLDAEFLTEEEKRDRRVFHGVWTDEDLNTPQRRATAALIRGSYDDPSLTDPTVAVEDRAEGMVLRGELEEALKLLGDGSGNRAARLRAQALEGLGKREEAGKAIEPVVAVLNDRNASVADLVEGVRGLLIRARVAPQKSPAGGDYNRMESILLDVSQKRDRVYWPAMVAEAELLYEKNKTKPASDAAMAALSLNPKCARAWEVLGRITVDQFNFDGTEKVAAQLTELVDTSGDGPVSADAAELLARARLRQNDPDGAAEALKPALEKYPKMRSLLAVHAATTALGYDFAKTDVELAAFDKLSSGSPLALYEVGRTLSEARQYAEAEKYLTRAAEMAPYWVEPAAELGLMSLQSGRDAEGLKSLHHAKDLDPFNTRVLNTLELAEELQKYQRIQSDHFILRYPPGVDEVLATDMVAQLEKMYKRVTGNGPGGIDFEPSQKTVIDLMPNQRWFAVRIAGVTQIHTMAASTGPTIAMEAPREGVGHKVGTYDWLRVVRHEFTHTVTLARTKNRIPHWFTEASAVNMEDSPRDYPTCQLLERVIGMDSLFDFSEINLAFIRPKKPTDRQQAYAQGQWMYEYMLKRWGNRAPLDLMDKYAAGEREDAAMKEVLGLDQSQFLEEFKGWAKKEVASWGMGPQKPSIRELLEEEATAQAKEAADKAAAEKAAGEKAEGDRPEAPKEPDAKKPDDAEGKPEVEKNPEPELPEPTLEMVNKWLEKYPENPDILELAESLTLQQSDQKPTAEMVPLLERYAKARPVDPLPHKLMAKLYTVRDAGDVWSAENVAKAVPHLEYLDAREQGSPVYAAELARAYLVLGESDKAAAKAERACTIAPYDANLRELAATIALTRKDYAAAEKQIVALTKLEPDRKKHKERLEAVRKLMQGAAR
jgi:tetratricopeptide (TPR) repeat protein